MAYYGGTQAKLPMAGSENRVLIGSLILVAILVFSFCAFILLADKDEKEVTTIVQKEVVKEMVPATPTFKVVVPRVTIWPGQEVTREMLKLSDQTLEPQQAQRVADTYKEVEGKFATAVLVEGMPIIKDQVTTTLSLESVVSKIPAGYRAVTIPVNAETAVEGWVRPGVDVDVVWTSTHRDKLFITTIVEKALVLSGGGAGPQAVAETKNSGSAGYVTLLLTVKQAQKVQLAKKSNGSLSLSLRGQQDEGNLGTETMAIDSLLKDSDIRELETVEGIRLNGEEYILKAGELVPSSEVENG